MVQSNVMDFSARNNAVIQNNAEGPMRKKLSASIEGTVEVETQKENNCLITWVDGDMTGDVDSE